MKQMKTTVIRDFSKGAIVENYRIRADGSLIKRDGYESIVSLYDTIRGAISIREDDGDIIYAVAGDTLWRVQEYDKSMLGTLENAVFGDSTEKVEMFLFAGNLYILGGGNYYCWNGDTLSVVEGYVPLIRRYATATDQGDEYERRNLLTRRVRMRLRPDGNSTQFRLYGVVASVEAVYIGGRLQTSGYTVNIGTTYSYVVFTYTLAYDQEDVIEVWYTLKNDDRREEITSCRHAAVYGGDTDSRVFVYGGNRPACIFPTDPQGADTRLTISAEYFPAGGEITVGDGNLFVSGAVRQFDRLAIFTEDSAFYTYPREEAPVNGIPRYSFPILPLNSDVGASRSGGAVLVENEPYALNENGLFRFKSTSVRDERLAVLVEAPEFAGLNRQFNAICQLYVNRLRGELWCFGKDPEYGDWAYIAVYNARLDVWYRFTGIAPDLMFTHQGNPAFARDDTLYRFVDGLMYDDWMGFSAVYDSGPLDLGNAFTNKTLYEVGAAVDCRQYTELYFTASDDHAESCEVYFFPFYGISDAPGVVRSNVRLEHTAYFSFRITSPEYTESACVHEVMLRYREG